MVIEVDSSGGSGSKQTLSEMGSGSDFSYVQINELKSSGSKPAILLTGATHAREMISTTMVCYQLLKLLQLGHVKKDPKYQQLFEQNKYLFMPIFNVDGVAFIEKNWKATKQIVPQRKNVDFQFGCAGATLSGQGGVDLNRNFGIDFGQVDDIVNYQQLNQLDNEGNHVD